MEEHIDAKIEEKIIPVQEQTQSKEEETPQQIDWRKFKEARRLERQQLEEERKRSAQKAQEAEALKAALDALVNKPTHSQEPTEETEEQKWERIVEQKLAVREKEAEIARRAKEQEELPSRLVQTYRDFDQICSQENLDYLEFHHPELSEAFAKLPNSFDKWSKIYNSVKRYIPNAANNKDQKKAEKNMTKPQSMSVAGVTQTGDSAPMHLDDQRKKDNWARMQKAMKRV
jgi:hypothetical protein